MKHLVAFMVFIISSASSAETPNEPSKAPKKEPTKTEKIKTWVEKSYDAAMEKEKDRSNDDERYLSNRIGSFFIGDLKLRGEYGYTNTNNTTSEPSAALPAHLDEDQTIYNVKFGWFDKKILRDIYLLTGTRERLKEYRNHKTKDKFYRWAWLDAVTVSANLGYGKVLEEGAGFELEPGDQRTKKNKLYFIGMKYEVPLSKLGGVFENLGGEFKE